VRILALLLLLAVLPTVELTEQVAHVVEHALHDQGGDAHDAHHSEPADEHGCTGLVHLCGLHAQVTLGATGVLVRHLETRVALPVAAPRSLDDLTAREPVHRPPIA
jgi:hypothetical protein